jgi:4,5-dihydroxyphthalate decarboxylase
MRDPNVSHFPLAWPVADAPDWPYGVEQNRATLETFLRYAHEQGVCAREMAPQDLFGEAVQTEFRV